MADEPNKQRKKLKIALGIVFAVVVVVILFLIPKLSPQTLRDYFQAKGSAAAIYYILTYTILPVFFFPVTPLAVAAGLVFSFWHGLIYTLIGAVINSTLTFILSRSLGQERFQALIIKHDSRGWVEKYQHSGQNKSFYILLLLRMIPVVPFTLLNYASGLGQISYGPYLLATLMGMLPGTMVMVNVGDKVLDTGSPQFFLSILLMIGLVVIGLTATKRISPDLDKASLREIVRSGNQDQTAKNGADQSEEDLAASEPSTDDSEAKNDPQANSSCSADRDSKADRDAHADSDSKTNRGPHTNSDPHAKIG